MIKQTIKCPSCHKGTRTKVIYGKDGQRMLKNYPCSDCGGTGEKVIEVYEKDDVLPKGRIPT